MATAQSYTLKKAGSSFADVDEARADIRATCDNASYFTYIDALVADGKLSMNETFDVDTQTYTNTRTWDDAELANWDTNHTSTSVTHQSKLTAAGYTITVA